MSSAGNSKRRMAKSSSGQPAARHKGCAITMAEKLNPGVQLVIHEKSEC